MDDRRDRAQPRRSRDHAAQLGLPVRAYPTGHVPGAHRRYTDEDVRRLRRMLDLTQDGMSPAAAARLVLDDTTAPEPARDGGGTGSVPVGTTRPAARGLARAASRLDVDGVHWTVARHFAERGVAATWEEVLVPLLRGLDAGCARNAEMIAAEHAASAATTRALHEAATPVPYRRLPVLLGCAPDEQHSLPLEALHAALGERGCGSKFLGARLPPEALLWSVRRLRPKVVVLWAHAGRTAELAPVQQLRDEPVSLLPVGPGWSAVRFPTDRSELSSLSEALEAVLAGSGNRAARSAAGP